MKTLREIIVKEWPSKTIQIDQNTALHRIIEQVLEQVAPSEKQDNGLTTEQYGFGKRDGFNECRNAVQSNITTILGK